ncbi:hypothetical protein C440_08677 [Haloferax mucosum ATCC BAA-1512]|uniref:Uncharacterized protein n=1 Tax=Haloferax mucosum ATCC BAA-1512 TaxID=662479 RepID=M0IH10_9EURY|nr:hypothetical protein C440_08677 [Haloferax mucosum ATCC BAA-1512]
MLFGILELLSRQSLSRALVHDSLGDYFLYFVMSILSQWGAILFGLVVLVALVLDIRGLRNSEALWRPNWAWGLLGLPNLAVGVYPPILAASVPLLSFYLYRRGKQVGTPSFGP